MIKKAIKHRRQTTEIIEPKVYRKEMEKASYFDEQSEKKTI